MALQLQPELRSNQLTVKTPSVCGPKITFELYTSVSVVKAFLIKYTVFDTKSRETPLHDSAHIKPECYLLTRC